MKIKVQRDGKGESNPMDILDYFNSRDQKIEETKMVAKSLTSVDNSVQQPDPSLLDNSGPPPYDTDNSKEETLINYTYRID